MVKGTPRVIKKDIDFYMEQRMAVFAYLDERAKKGKLNKHRITVDEVMQNVDVDHGFSVRDQIKQYFVEQARKNMLHRGRHTSVNDEEKNAQETSSQKEENAEISTSDENKSTTTKEECKEESNSTKQGDVESKEETL